LVLPIQVIIYTAIIFNTILRVQVFPKQWKLAVTLMIQKAGKPEVDPQSYRTISLLPFLLKLWERLIANRINDYIRQGLRLRVLQRGSYRYAISLRQSMACWIVMQDKNPSTCDLLLYFKVISKRTRIYNHGEK